MKLNLTPEDLELLKQVAMLTTFISGWTVAATGGFLKTLAMIYPKDLHNAVKMAISVLFGVLITLGLHLYFGLLSNPLESLAVGAVAGFIGTGAMTTALHISKSSKSSSLNKEPYPV